MKLQTICAAFLLWSLVTFPAGAMWIRYETERVPIARLLTNLQQRLATNGQNVEVLYQLARVHSMAYATNLAFVPVTKEDMQPMFDHPGEDTGVPRKVSLQPTLQAQADARYHLTNAIAYYRQATKLVVKSSKPNDRWLVIPIHLGLAWCLDQSGSRKEAIEAYRDALQHAWRKEVDGEFTFRERAEWSWDRLRAGQNPLAKPKRGYLGPGVCYSEEIIGYLLALLDPQKDAKEIAQLQSDRKQLQSMGRAITPILMPLHRDVALDELVNPDARIAFDLDGSGHQRRWGWITTNAAWLVYDHDGSGRITSGLQMFGSVTFWIFWRDGYQALSSLDNDHDGQLTGDELRGLALWNDRNGDGISDVGEVTPVSELGIVAIDCGSARHPSGIRFNERGAIFRDGSSRATYDWIAPSR
jgi:hypothetical protein